MIRKIEIHSFVDGQAGRRRGISSSPPVRRAILR